MTKCNNCESFVTPTFARVFGDNDGSVYGCPECMDLWELNEGHAAVGSADQLIE